MNGDSWRREGGALFLYLHKEINKYKFQTNLKHIKMHSYNLQFTTTREGKLKKEKRIKNKPSLINKKPFVHNHGVVFVTILQSFD